MAYLTADLAAAEFKGLDISESTAVTPDKLDEFIKQEEASLNGQLGTIYSVPVILATSPISFSIMRLITTMLVRDRLEAILAVKTGGKTPDQGDENGTPWAKKAKDLIDKLLKKEMILPDATLLNSTGGVQGYTSANDLCPIFKKETKQW